MFKSLTISLTLLLTVCNIDSTSRLRYAPGAVKEHHVHNDGKRVVVAPGVSHHIATAKVNLSGKYYIRECFDGHRVVSTPRWFKFTLEITAHAVGHRHTYIGYKLTYTVGNKLWAHMIQIKDGRWAIVNDGQTKDFRSVSPNTDEAKAERFVLNFEKWFTHFKVNADVVTFYGKNGSRMVLVRAKAERKHY